jgi:fructose-1,6-bisphosphatase II
MAIDPDCEVDIMMGTGGTPEGVLAACAIRGLNGEMLTRLDPQSSEERESLFAAGIDMKKIRSVKDLVKSEDVFFAATGISGGTFLPGVRYTGTGAITESLVIRGRTGTMRYVRSIHNLKKLQQFSAIQYGG